ncbi:hypothetical protein HOLleu_09367 [Holothuria leucospilota]|uniref:C2H2-type domain-containing protein n=1 Tax=Holothuria leucospilota TaxID=206669 RepID=A0A9Q1HB05_HOLLE|nr:hypothetical protein HOLleu_09367 [Holothuria leucospilota]
MNQLSREEERLVEALERVERLQLAERQRQAFLQRRSSSNAPPSSPPPPTTTMQTALPEKEEESLPDTQPVAEVFDISTAGSSEPFTVACDEGCGKSFSTRKAMKKHRRQAKDDDTPIVSRKRKRSQNSSGESPMKKKFKREEAHDIPMSVESSPVKKKPNPLEDQDVPMRDLSSTSRDIPSTSRDMPSTSGAQKDIKDDFFCLFPNAHYDLYHLFRNNIVGGPSIIFHRYHERDLTKLKGGKLCKKVLGFDANALYLWAVMQHLPTGVGLRRRRETGFRREFTHSFQKTAAGWLEWEGKRHGIEIKHRLNGKEVRLGKRHLPVNGFGIDNGNPVIFQFQGCYWHGHLCALNQGKTHNQVNGKPLSELFEETKAITKHLKSLGYEFVEKWACEWRQDQAECPEIRQFLKDRYPYPYEEKFYMDEDSILQHVKTGDMFGVVECDITVPDHLKSKFAEMPPIFKNAQVGIKDVGEHMARYAEQQKVLKQPRRTLIGSMHGTKILLATPLLRWYLEHGLVVTQIYQVVQFMPQAVFETFGEKVSAARREGDSDPSKSILADTMKLIGNSAYGKTVTKKENHLDVKVCTEDNVFQRVNDPFFKRLTPLGSGMYEVDLHKRVILVDLPLQIGFFVYQYAKLRMLQFYYDFMCKFVDPSDFQYCEMDTDSAYLAISGESLESVIKPDMRALFEAEKHLWFPRTDTPEHKQFDKRTPGLFKLEWEGDGIVALNSKCYYCFGSEKEKLSKAAQLLRKINSSNGDLSWTDKGELVVKDRVIKVSHMVDFINDVVRKRKGIIPIGATDFAKGLAELNLPRELVGNPDRWKEMTRWLEDPTPEIDSSTKSPEVGGATRFLKDEYLYGTAHHLPPPNTTRSRRKQPKAKLTWEKY